MRFPSRAMPAGNMAVRGSHYLGDMSDLFKQMMPTYVVDHINGNAIYNQKSPWTSALSPLCVTHSATA